MNGSGKHENKKSVIRFIEIWFVVLWILFSLMLFSMYYLLSNQLENILMRNTNRENIQMVEKLIRKNGSDTISLDESYALRKGYYVVVLDMDHRQIGGTCPTAFDDYPFDRTDESVVELNSRKYVLSYEIIHRKDRTKDLILCGIADTHAAFTVLDNIKLNIIGFIVIALTLLIIVCLLLRERIAGPLRKMNEDALRLGNEMNFNGEKITESGFMEIDMLEEAYMKLFEKMSSVIDSQNRFNADVSHELRTPITVIQTQCQLSRERALETGDRDKIELIDVIDRQTERMKKIINILIRLSKLEGGAAVLSPEQFDLAMLVESACEGEESAAFADRKVVFELEETIISADVNLIMIAFRNILSNAVKYSGSGSEIRISCGTAEGRPFCSVSDQGIGIRKETMDKIYDNYYRSEESRSSEGFGLGLSLTRKIMELHGGEVKGESVPGEGSTFTLYFAMQ